LYRYTLIFKRLILESRVRDGSPNLLAAPDGLVTILEAGLVILKIYNGFWFFGRPTVDDLRQDLRAVLKKCRLDWDITKPELKAAWERGERDRFYPYGKTYGQVFRQHKA
jgi:hypothetical protein